MGDVMRFAPVEGADVVQGRNDGDPMAIADVISQLLDQDEKQLPRLDK